MSLSLCPLGCENCSRADVELLTYKLRQAEYPWNTALNWIPIAYEIAVSPRGWALGYTKETNAESQD